MLIKSFAVGLLAVVIAGCSHGPKKSHDRASADENVTASAAQDEDAMYECTSLAQQRTHVPRRIQRFDANHDGVLTPNEIPPRLRTWFAEVDTNHDNIVTAQEIHAYNRAHPHPHHHDGQPQPQPQPQQTSL